MALTPFQIVRVKFHFKVPTNQPVNTAVHAERALLVDALTPEDELQVIGDISDPTDPSHFILHGQIVAAENSLLYHCENAYQKLNPNDVDPSLFVAAVGTIRLRANELAKRTQFYEYHVDRMAQVFNYLKEGAPFATDENYSLDLY